MKYRCMVVDDEVSGVEVLEDLIKEVPLLELTGSYHNPVAALSALSLGQTDILFLDIDMPRLSGLELARLVRDKVRFIVFTTAYQQYAVEAFELRADHYLLKPITYPKFLAVINGLLQHLPTPSKDFFFIRGDQKAKLVKLHLDEIQVVEGLKNYVILYTATGKYIAYLTMKEVEEELCLDPRFKRIHKSFIISPQHIVQIEANIIRMSCGKSCDIGATFKASFFQYIEDITLKTKR